MNSEVILTARGQGKKHANSLSGRFGRVNAASVIPNENYGEPSGRIVGSSGRMTRNSVRQSDMNITSGTRSGSNILNVSKGGKRNLIVGAPTDLDHIGDRLHGPLSEPRASLRSDQGVRMSSIVWNTPTTQAPIARAAFAGGGVDSVPTVTPMTPSQSRIATTMNKKRMLRAGGSHYIPRRQRAFLGNRDVPQGGNLSGNQKDKYHWSNMSSILEPLNQSDTDITSQYPNPMEPLAATDPVEQQEIQLRNFRGALRLPMESKDFPYLSKSRGLERNLDGKGMEIGPFDTETESNKILSVADSISWN